MASRENSRSLAQLELSSSRKEVVFLSEVKKQLIEWDVVKIVLAVNGALAGIVAAVASLIT